MALSEEELCGACAACMLTGRSSAGVLSENLAAGSGARSVGSDAATGEAFFASYVGSTKTKSLDEVLAVSAACGATGCLTGATGDGSLLAVSLTGAATGFAELAPPAVCCV